jgi:hypothetical protein
LGLYTSRHGGCHRQEKEHPGEANPRQGIGTDRADEIEVDQEIERLEQQA